MRDRLAASELGAPTTVGRPLAPSSCRGDAVTSIPQADRSLRLLSMCPSMGILSKFIKVPLPHPGSSQ